MITVSYDFFVVPRHHGAFDHAYRAMHFALRHTPGLNSLQFDPPPLREAPFSLRLIWDPQSSFERFTRTWPGVWVVNGMGLVRGAYCAPVQTAISRQALCSPRAQHESSGGPDECKAASFCPAPARSAVSFDRASKSDRSRNPVRSGNPLYPPRVTPSRG